MIELSHGDLHLDLCEPGTFYQGTRFDWNGVFRSIKFRSLEFSGLWFDTVDPLRHDNLTGCSEEFAPVWVDSTHCMKIGVGMLEVPGGKESYDRFKLYRISDPGQRRVDSDGKTAVFSHTLNGYYEYKKVISIVDTDKFEIRHEILWTAGFSADYTCYNHNFFTFGTDSVGPRRSFIFDSKPVGTWREDSVNAFIKGRKLLFEVMMEPGEKAFVGNLHIPEFPDRPYHFQAREGACGVDVSADVSMEFAVFWSNDRVACVEPYVRIAVGAGESFGWKIVYSFKK